MQLRQDYSQFTKRNTEVLVIAPDDPGDLKSFWISEALPFPALLDADHEVASRYRQEFNLLKLGRMPAMLIVDREGCIAYQHFGASMSDIPANAQILALLDRLNRGEAAHEEARQPESRA